MKHFIDKFRTISFDLWIWYRELFLKNFCYYALLPLILLLVVGVVTEKIGAKQGIGDLVWLDGGEEFALDQALRQFTVGLAVSVLVLTLLYVGYLLWLRDYAKQPPQPDLSGLVVEPAKTVTEALATVTAQSDAVAPEATEALAPPHAPGQHAPGAPAETPAAAAWPRPTDATPFWIYALGVLASAMLTGLALRIIFKVVALGGDLSTGWSAADEDPGPVESLVWLNRLWLPAGAIVLTVLVLLLDWLSTPKSEDSRRPAPERSDRDTVEQRTAPSPLQLFFIGVFVVAVCFVVVLCVSARDWENLGWLGAVIGVSLAGVWGCRRFVGRFRVLSCTVLLIAAYLLITWLFSQDWRYGWCATFFLLVILNLGLYPWMQQHHEPSHWDPLTLSRYHRYAPHAGLAGLLFFGVACLIPGLRSPLIFGCFLLFGLVAVYGFFVLFIRRWLPVALGLLAFLTILAGLQTYHFRFDNLTYGAKVNLKAQIDKEGKEARRFDELVLAMHQSLENAGYFKAKEWLDKFGHKQAELRKLEADLKAARSESERQHLAERLEANRIEIEQEQELADQKQETVDFALDLIKNDRAKAQRDWVELENKHQLLPLRMVPPPMRDFVVRWDAKELSENNLVPAEKLNYQSGNPLVVVVVSGGGLRSAAWTFAVLKELELQLADHDIDFARNVRLIAGASGGMLGASYYVVTLPDGPAGKDERGAGRKEFLDDNYQRLTKDCLTPVVQQMILGDIPGFFAPWIARHDRGKALEQAWAENLDGALDRPFAELRAAERAGAIPSLVFTPMMIEDGRRLLISNLDLRNILTNDGCLLSPLDPGGPHLTQLYSRDAFELFRLFPKDRDRFKLSTAVRMSATFAFFSPAVSLPTTPRRRVVDAGYFDNYGVSLASSWLFSSRNEALFKRNNIDRFLLIQIRDGSSHPQRTLAEVSPQARGGFGWAFEEITSPLEGLYNGHEGSSSFRNDGQLELLNSYLKKRENAEDFVSESHDNKSFAVMNIEFPDTAPLSWYLKPADQKRLKLNAYEEVRKHIGQLSEWWDTKKLNSATEAP